MPPINRNVTQGGPLPVRHPLRKQRQHRRVRYRTLSGASSLADVQPVLHVEFGFGSPASTPLANVSWTSVSDDCRGYNYRRGRSSELDDMQTGTCTITLSNRDRKYDPSYTAGPYYGRLLPLVPVRVYARFNGVNYPRFTGFATNWPQDYEGPTSSVVSVSCVDGFEVLDHARMPPSVLAYEQSVDNPKVQLSLADGSTPTTAVDSSGNHYDGTYQGTVSSASALTYGGDGATTFTAGSNILLPAAAGLVDHIAAGNGFVITAVVKSTNVAAAQVYFQQTAGNTYSAGLQLDGSGRPRIWYTINGAGFCFRSDVSVTDGLPHHIIGRWVANPLIGSVTVDGVTAAISDVASGFSQAQVVSVGGSLNIYDVNFVGTIDDFAIYQVVMDGAAGVSTRRVQHYNAYHAPWDNDDTGARIGHLLDAAGINAADRDLDTGVTILGPATLTGNGLTDCKTVAHTEQGRFYMSADGKYTFRNRQTALLRAEASTSQATFGDSFTTELPYYVGNFHLRYDRDLIVNTISAARVGGGSVIVEDTASVTTYGTRSTSETGLLYETDNEVKNFAEYRIGRYKDPALRLESIQLKPRTPPPAGASWTSTQMWTAVLNTEINNRYTVMRRPQNVGSAITITALCEGVSETVQPGLDWITELYLSPVDTLTYWLLGTNTLDVDTRLGF